MKLKAVLLVLVITCVIGATCFAEKAPMNDAPKMVYPGFL